MAIRNQSIIKRNINRLYETVERNKEEHSSLAALYPKIKEAAILVNESWQNLQQISIQGSKEREERDAAILVITKWMQRWRPVVLLNLPGAADNIRSLPSTSATPDDLIRRVQDLATLIQSNPGAASFSASALSELGDSLEKARKETIDASVILPQESTARQVYSDACVKANDILVNSLDTIRAIFGKTSPEYKQFIARSSAKDQEVNKDKSSIESL